VIIVHDLRIFVKSFSGQYEVLRFMPFLPLIDFLLTFAVLGLLVHD